MILVILVMAIGLLLGAVALASTLDSRTLENRDVRSIRAQAAADAGVQAQIYQQSEAQIGGNGSTTALDLNSGPSLLAELSDCVVPTFNASLQITGLVQTQVANANAGACPSYSSAGTACTTTVCKLAVGDHGYEESEFIPAAASETVANGVNYGIGDELSPKIVSLGWDDGGNAANANGIVYRREEAILQPISALPVLGATGNLAIQGVTITNPLLSTVLGLLGLNNLDTTVNGDVQAAGNISVPAVFANPNLSLTDGLLGVVTYGGPSYSGGIASITTKVNEAPPTRQTVSISSSTPSCPPVDATVPRQANCADLGSAYSSSTDSVYSASGGVTIPGGNYVFCNFDVEAGTVTLKPTAADPVRIFIDSPQSKRCASDGNSSAQGNFIAKPGISDGALNLGGVLTPSQLQIYVVGSNVNGNSCAGNTVSTCVELGTPPTGNTLLSTNQATEAGVVYAPTSTVSMTTAQCALGICVPGTFDGVLIGNNVTATALVFTQDLDLGSFPLYNGINTYQVEQYVQCSDLNKSGTPVTSLTGNATTDTSGC
ncbi:MAG TPA: hypothetical protein VHX88_11845 [Solirubrobacteraceae bacterium]|nr:hypothetical protein [Solirubrobacteraceae bacterium]